jgi:hypothetical protein
MRGIALSDEGSLLFSYLGELRFGWGRREKADDEERRDGNEESGENCVAVRDDTREKALDAGQIPRECDDRSTGDRSNGSPCGDTL